MNHSEWHQIPRYDTRNEDLPVGASVRKSLQDRNLGDEGIEHPPLTLSEIAISAEGGAESDAHDALKPSQDSDLAQIVAAWPKLPEHVKAAIKTLVEAHTDGRREEHSA